MFDSSLLEKPKNYDPGKYRMRTFHDARNAFIENTDTPRAYLERCLETIEQLEPAIRA